MNNMSNTSNRNRSEQVGNHEINRSHMDKEKIAKGWENLTWQYMFDEKNEKTRDIRVQKEPLATPTIFNKGELESTMPTFCRPKALDCISSPAWLVGSCSSVALKWCLHIWKLTACDFHVSMSFLKFSPFFKLNFWSWSPVFSLLSLRFLYWKMAASVSVCLLCFQCCEQQENEQQEKQQLFLPTQVSKKIVHINHGKHQYTSSCFNLFDSQLVHACAVW